MGVTEKENQTAITEFILLGFGDFPEMQPLLFVTFLFIYTITMSGNIVIVLVIAADHNLHTPMYFFLGNLSFLEICYTTTIVPKMLRSFLTALLKLSCTDTRLVEFLSFTVSACVTLVPFLLTLTSYCRIILTIRRIPSTTGKQKAFSTCSSHLLVVSIFYGTIIIVYGAPVGNQSPALNKAFSLLYTVISPMFNPLIYSLRNKEVKCALRKVGSKVFTFLKKSNIL
ncbi:olfactory receptor 1L4-like [Gopherus flavomarginatus]|uniref:olfactory receptor 1L4-like n=1 Tax=Gopherus flavomarginatus TaxID=286002 RepID=UPI0021CBF023|nr:olfactory receptor 1L4-like [Gopherus flavomarginatus]